jgi:hypothetical protein
MFCTYAHYTPQGRLFYIGKGSSERRAHYMQGRNNYWNKIVAKYGKPEVQILANWNTEEEAFSHEVLLISCFRDMGYKLANLTDGGEGFVGLKFSEEHKTKLSKARIGKIPWNKGKVGLPSYTKGYVCSEETKAKLRLASLGKVGVKHTNETKNKIRMANIGNTKPLKYKMIGTNKETGEQVFLLGTKAIKEAGFNSVLVRECAKGLRKSHKGYMWTREILEKN